MSNIYTSSGIRARDAMLPTPEITSTPTTDVVEQAFNKKMHDHAVAVRTSLDIMHNIAKEINTASKEGEMEIFAKVEALQAQEGLLDNRLVSNIGPPIVGDSKNASRSRRLI